MTGTSNFGLPGSLFGYFATVTNGTTSGSNIAYCATGSAKGIAVFDAAVNADDGSCAGAVTGGAFGFLPPSTSPRQASPSITGTDVPLTSSEYGAYVSNHAAPEEPVELPAFFYSIAIVYHANNGTTGRSNATTASLCGVYNGKVKTIGALLGNGDATPIVPIVRSDGSGTTFSFANHLATVCSGGGYNGSQNAIGGSPVAFPSLPSNALRATSDYGVVLQTNATIGAVGYVASAYVLDAQFAYGVNYATIDGKDPIANLPEAANVAANALIANVYVNQVTGPATTTRFTPRNAGTKCVEVISPASYANPRAGYSILAVTNLLLNSTGNGSAGASSLKTLETIINTSNDFKNRQGSAPITTVDAAEPSTGMGAGTTGYSSLGFGFSSTLRGASSACIGV